MRRVKSLDLPPVVAEFADASGFENDGYSSKEIVAAEWMVTLGVWAGLDGSSLPLSEQEFVRLASMDPFGQSGNRSRLHWRFYDKNGGLEAFDGYGYTTWKYDGGDWKGLAGATITVQGDGPLTVITNPLVGSQVPIIANALPTLRAPGDLLKIYGNKFTASAISAFTIDAQPVLKYTVDSDNVITCIVPATVAGAANIIITNAAGASNTYAYTAA
jgi:hypothetical protein